MIIDSWPDFVNLKNDIVSGKGRYIGLAVSNIFQGLFVKMKITENRIIFIFKCQKKDFCKCWLLNWIESYFGTNAILYLCIKRDKKKPRFFKLLMKMKECGFWRKIYCMFAFKWNKKNIGTIQDRQIARNL